MVTNELTTVVILFIEIDMTLVAFRVTSSPLLLTWTPLCVCKTSTYKNIRYLFKGKQSVLPSQVEHIQYTDSGQKYLNT